DRAWCHSGFSCGNPEEHQVLNKMQALRDLLDDLFQGRLAAGAVPLGIALVLLLVGGAVALWNGFSCAAAVALAQAAIARGDYARARVWAERAVRRARNDLALAAALDQLGAVHRFMGGNHDAEACYREALDLRQRNLPPDHRDIGASLN